MSLSRAEAAQALGMKQREIIGVERAAGGGYVVTTHDQQRTLVSASGQVVATGDVLDTAGALPAVAPATAPAPVTPAPAPAPATEADVPDGTVGEVLAWVGGDPHRAQLAAAVESRRPQPRTTLAEQLDRIRVDALDGGSGI